MSDEAEQIDNIIAEGYHDGFGTWHETSTDTRESIRNVLASANAGSEVLLAEAGKEQPLPTVARIRLEDGTEFKLFGKLPADLPIGYHQVEQVGNDLPALLIVHPNACYLEESMRQWGWAVQLYAVRSKQSWGIGDFGDLAQLARSSVAHGADLIQVNPLTALAPTVPQTDSPYFASTRCFLNPIYLKIENVLELFETSVDVSDLAAKGQRLLTDRIIDRDVVFELKLDALQRIYASSHLDARFLDFCSSRGDTLFLFAAFSAIAEKHGGDYRRWPTRLRAPNSPEVQRFAEKAKERILFYQWLQWLCDMQLSQTDDTIDVITDLPVGFDPGGFDAWRWQDLLGQSMSIGAPPDSFNKNGQNWGIPPFSPTKLRAAKYAPFIETIRANLRHAGGLRIDHVMSLYRLFWIPDGMEPLNGTYVRYRHDELLAILAVESTRAQSWIAGEDLGTVPTGMRERLAEMNVLSHRLAIFDPTPPTNYPRKTLAAINTHDLPTLAGLWSGKDIKAVRAMGREPHEEDYIGMVDNIKKLTGLSEETPVENVIAALYDVLGKGNSSVVLASLEDVLAVPERPNMPGTLNEWPNWRISLPALLHNITSNANFESLANALRK